MRCDTCGAVAGGYYPYTGVEVRLGPLSLWYPGKEGGRRFCSNECWNAGFAQALIATPADRTDAPRSR